MLENNYRKILFEKYINIPPPQSPPPTPNSPAKEEEVKSRAEQRNHGDELLLIGKFGSQNMHNFEPSINIRFEITMVLSHNII